MFDTNIFNKILDEKIDPNSFKNEIVCCVTHIQADEINNTSNESRRTQLNEMFKEIVDKDYPTSSAICGISRCGAALVGDGKFFSAIKARLDKKNNKKSNNSMDALIGETAIANNLTLVTHDMELFSVMTELKCSVANIYQILKIHKNKQS